MPRILSQIFVVAVFFLTFTMGCSSIQAQPAGISQHIEVRDGREREWGIDIRLDKYNFRRQIQPDQINLIDGKRGIDLRHLMTWTVSNDRQHLAIRFKPGMGDFGSGNEITVHIDRSAIVNYQNGNRMEWSIQTDPL